MTYQEANHISIKDYLKSLGILPAVDKYYYGMYHSPFRQDDTPSFKVDYGVNLWCDFGTGEGGSLIDLVMKQHGCNAYGAICRLEQYSSGNSFSFQRKEVSERIQHERKQPTSPIDIRKIQPLQNPALMKWQRTMCRKCITVSVTSLILRLLSRTMPEVTNFAIHVSRGVHHPKTSHTYGSQAKRTIAVLFSRE